MCDGFSLEDSTFLSDCSDAIKVEAQSSHLPNGYPMFSLHQFPRYALILCSRETTMKTNKWSSGQHSYRAFQIPTNHEVSDERFSGQDLSHCIQWQKTLSIVCKASSRSSRMCQKGYKAPYHVKQGQESASCSSCSHNLCFSSSIGTRCAAQEKHI